MALIAEPNTKSCLLLTIGALLPAVLMNRVVCGGFTLRDLRGWSQIETWALGVTAQGLD